MSRTVRIWLDSKVTLGKRALKMMRGVRLLKSHPDCSNCSALFEAVWWGSFVAGGEIRLYF